jgi:hypothetical protein
MSLQSSDVEERVAESAIESLAQAAWASSSADIHETPTLLPPPPDESPESEPPPTARWTPPPALIASAQVGSRQSST